MGAYGVASIPTRNVQQQMRHFYWIFLNSVTLLKTLQLGDSHSKTEWLAQQHTNLLKDMLEKAFGQTDQLE
ncbi:hypothetical protein ACJX0J_034580, partial [Zea mays]